MPAGRRASARRYSRYGSWSACPRCYRYSSVLCLPPHHDDFFTPGTCPCDDSMRKQMRQMPNFRMYERGRPQRLQRLCCETACLCLRSPRFTVDFLATQSQPHFLKGNPSSASSARALRDFSTTGCWPVIFFKSAVAASCALGLEIASPIPMLTTTLVNRGTCMALL